ncbi:MAG: hypothetical protein KGL10_09870, partial [Alphaproteobacteria bacterium]|nr:hypothetical protein [Alphaproteobacteria bacterium]
KENGSTLRAAAPIDAVAKALSDAGLLPKSFTDEIAAVAEKGHRNQNRINAEIAGGAPPQPAQKAAAPKL